MCAYLIAFFSFLRRFFQGNFGVSVGWGIWGIVSGCRRGNDSEALFDTRRVGLILSRGGHEFLGGQLSEKGLNSRRKAGNRGILLGGSGRRQVR